MNVPAIARMLSGFVLFFVLAQVVPLAVALLAGEDTAGFDTSLGVGLATAACLRFAGRRADMRMFFRREALAVVALAWPVAGVLGALPYWCSAVLENPVDAVFESVSGLTTTGASVLGSPVTPAIEDVPRSLLLWRSMEQWLGGMGIVLVFVVLLPGAGVVGKNLLSAEEVGVAGSADRPRLRSRARRLFQVYLALTLLDVCLLRVAGIDTWFDAVCHAFTTMSTGGFSTRNASIAAYDSLGVELVTIVFMALAAMNFVFLLSLVAGRPGRPRSLAGTPEVRLYAYFMTGLVLVAALALWARGGSAEDPLSGTRDYSSFATCLRDAAFNVVSNLTCTGFATADYQAWPGPAILLFLVAMLVGGCTGSTSGGIKIMRLLVAGKLVAHSLQQFTRPRSVATLRVGRDPVPDSVVSAVMSMVLLWLASIAIGGFLMLLDPRVDLLSAVSAPISMLACCGPAMSDGPLNIGPAGSYGLLTDPTKVLLLLQMILGRLEILAPLMLVLPGFWRR